ncbi:MAG TPA: two-component system response regulator [Lachnospiraceae bacterium]|nr:two-component system response regulator [Lachnospiraceae bacterium]HCX42467.1 two-component system response regulator [Lachnospiraceae bacterium]
MMIKIFLVEDEIAIRKGIKNSIDWEKEGYEFVGEAGDGELAYPMILKMKPDILITDIKMPFMDGLQLSKLVRKELPATKILILSGYDEFEYAKEAIKLQVAEYLLKPISSAKLLDVLAQVKEVIRQEQEEKELIKKYREDMKENRELEKERFLNQIITQNLSLAQILETGESLGMDLSAPLYNILLLKITENGGKQETYAEIESALDTLSGVFSFRRGVDEWLFLLTADDAEKMERRIESCRKTVRQITEKTDPPVEYFGALGNPVERLREIKNSLKEAEKKFAFQYLKKWNQILEIPVRDVGSSENPQTEKNENEELLISSVQVDKLNHKIIENFIHTGLRREVSNFVDDYFMSLGEKSVQSLMFRQYVAMDFYLAAVAFLERLGFSSKELVERCGDLKEMEQVIQTIEQTKEYIKKVLDATLECRESVSRKRYSDLLKEAVSYIEHHYEEEDISLNQVAASVNISPSHFSTIFSKEMGETFIEYLTNVRMERAKQLLRSSTMKTAEIAYAVGYKDAHYFSYLFKKVQKCTPREFRTQV